MIQLIKKIIGIGSKVDFSQIMSNGATIIDVRTKGEYQSGHIIKSVNIPLDDLKNRLTNFKKDKPIITCCASGMRSASAKSILKSNGFVEVYNGGNWATLQQKIM